MARPGGKEGKGAEEADYHMVIKVNSCRILPEFGNYSLYS